MRQIDIFKSVCSSRHLLGNLMVVSYFSFSIIHPVIKINMTSINRKIVEVKEGIL